MIMRAEYISTDWIVLKTEDGSAITVSAVAVARRDGEWPRRLADWVSTGGSIDPLTMPATTAV